MEPQILVVSHPPHGEVDYARAGAALGLDVDDARLKFDFRAPEVLAASEPDRATEIAAALRGAGLTVAVLDGTDLARIPWPTLVTSLRFGDDALVTSIAGDEEITLPYDLPLLAVYCSPPDGFPHDGPANANERPSSPQGPGGEGLVVAESIQWMALVDLYFVQGGEHDRLTIARDVTDFSGLGTLQGATPTESVANVVAELGRRFPRLELDARLEDVRPRQRFVMGESGFDLDLRKRFSFGTLLLRQMLDSISPALRDVPQYELASRLAYLLGRRG